VLPPRERLIVRGELLEQDGRAVETHAQVGAFDQVVAQDRLLGQPARQDLVKDADIVDGLADEDPVAEQVLIKIRDGVRIRVRPPRMGKNGGEARGDRGRKARNHARLNDSVTLDDHAPDRVDDRLVERMRHGFDQAQSRAVRKLGVGVERDDVANTLERPTAAEPQELPGRLPHGAVEEPVQIFDLPPLALPPRPAVLGCRK